MPARTLPPVETGRGAAVIKKKPSVVPTRDVKVRQLTGNTANGRASATAPVKGKVTASTRKAAVACQEEDIIKAITSQSKCTKTTLSALLSHLDITTQAIGLQDLVAVEKGKSSINGSARPSRQPNLAKAPSATSSFSSERIHFAKQVVNASITSLNDLLSAGWKASTTTTSAQASCLARPPSTSSRASSTISSKTGPPLATIKTEANVDAIFCCARLAIHYLYEAQRANYMRASTELELQNIMSSLVRKVISMEMYRLASSEIDWLHDTLIESYTDSDTAPSYGFPFPSAPLSTRQRELLLEIQAAAMSCILSNVSANKVQSSLDTILQHPQGPISWQQYLRRSDVECSAEIADKHAYSIDRVLTKLLARIIKSASDVDATVAFTCRKYSIDLLMHVSDLAIDAFWDRIARTGLTYYKIRTSAEATTSREKQETFQVVDGFFRDVHRKVQQSQRGHTMSSEAGDKLQGKGFSSLCEAWLQLARRAGDGEAMKYVSSLLAREVISIDLRQASKKEISSLVIQACAELSMSVCKVEDLLVGENSINSSQILRAAETKVTSALGIASAANDEEVRKIFKILDQLRRRASKFMEEKKCNQGDITTLLVAICNQYEQYLLLAESTRESHSEDEEILDDFIYMLRSLANTTFDLNDWKSHQASSTFLNRCSTLLESKKGRMKRIKEMTIAAKLRLLSSSWYFIGGKLYNEKKLSMAIPFLKNACNTAQQAFNMSKDSSANEMPIDKSDNILKKWEHLAVSYRYTNQYKLAVEAYTKGLLCTDSTVWDTIIERVRKEPICDLSSTCNDMEEDKRIKSIFSMTRVIFELSTYELMDSKYMAREEGFAKQAISKGVKLEAIAALLESCLLSLDDTMHREGAPLSAVTLIEELLRIYELNAFPIRRARVMIRKMELAAMQPQLYQDGLDDLQDEVRNLLIRQEYGLDATMIDFVPQYQSMLYMSLVMLDQQHSTSPKKSKVSDLIDEISLWLGRIPQASKIDSAILPPPKQIRSRTLKVTQVPRQKPLSRAPSTPARGKKVQLTSITTISKDAGKQRSLLDNPFRLCEMIMMLVEVIDSKGYIVPLFTLIVSALKLTKELRTDVGLEMSVTLAIALIRKCFSMNLYDQAGICICQYQDKIKVGDISADTRCRFLFLSAQYHAHVEEDTDTKASMLLYKEAVSIASEICLEDRVSSLQSGVNKSLISERQSLAAETYALIQQQRGDATSALRYALLSLRCIMKCSMMLSRLTALDENKGGISFPFGQSKEINSDGVVESPLPSPTALETDSVDKRAPRLSSSSVAKAHWRINRTLLNAYLNVARLYQLRGSARDTEAFLMEAIDFCKGTNNSIELSRCLLQRGVLYYEMGQTEKGAAGIQEGSCMIGAEEDSIATMEMQIALAIQGEKRDDLRSSLQCLSQAEEIRLALQERLESCFKLMSSTTRDGKTVQKGSIIMTRARSEILLRRARILSKLGHDEKSIACIEQARSCPLSIGVLDLQEAKTNLDLACQSLKQDQIMGLLHESVLSLPRQSRPNKSICQVKVKRPSLMRSNSGLRVNQAQLYLKKAQDLLEKATLQEKWQRIDSITLRESCFNLAYIASLDSVMGKACKTIDVVSVLERACSLTLQGEMLDTLESKGDQRVGLTTASIPEWKTSIEEMTTVRSGIRTGSEESSSDGEGNDEDARQGLESMRRRHTLAHTDLDLPDHYTVVSITLYRERNCLVLTRRSGKNSSCCPVVCHLAIDRHNHREGEDNPSASIEAVFSELKTIVDDSNKATHSAQHLKGMQARKEWWTKRRELDGRLKNLLELIETTWLGAFKSVLMPRFSISATDLAIMRSSLDALFQKSLFINSSSSSSNDKKSLQDVLDDGILERFITLSQAVCTDEELEDLVHFIMDAFQLQECPVAIDEVDMDQCVTDLRGILDSFKSKFNADKNNRDDHHHFLILDKNTSVIPWESLPILRDQAVCRIPSLAFLQDRLDHKHTIDGRFTIASRTAKVSYLLNPSKDLTRTQERFGPWLESKAKDKSSSTTSSRWSGISNRIPLMDELANALQTADLLLYFGHGGAEQYIRANRLKSLKKCAVTMLWGCSSAVLKDLGEYDRIGTPLNYLMAGSPSLLGNLWDTTDKELDGISESVFEKMGLWRKSQGHDDDEKKGRKGENRNISMAQAVAKSRNACKLPYLTGAACVIYGIPVYYQ